jgi:predicted dehydrogenase
MNKPNNVSRRNFIGTVGAAAAAFTIVPNHVIAGRGKMQPSDTLNVAGIGVGSQGGGDIQQLCTPDVAIVRPQRNYNGTPYTKEQLAAQQAQAAAAAKQATGTGAAANTNAIVQMGNAGTRTIKLANIYALCDIDPNYSGYLLAGYPKAKKYTDWREMLDKEPGIDAVVIGTPDHNHAVIASAFMKAKKHVYCEKPMAKTIYEVRKMAEIAKQMNVVTQMGNQGHATEGTRQTVEWIQSGAVGAVREVHLSTNRPMGFWPQGDIPRPAAQKIPKGVNYDLWIGPAPFKPYNVETFHFNWRGLWDYGTGAMGDMGAHIFDAPIWALNLGLPVRIQATSTPYNDEYMPLGETVVYEFPERYTPGIGYMPPVKVTWCDGGLRPERPAQLEPGRAVADATYIGDKGVIMHGSHGAMPQMVPNDPGFKAPSPWLERTGNIFEDWIGAIKAGKKACNDFSISSKLTEIMLLTNVAVRSQRANITLEYDGANMKVTNYPEANNYLQYEYRSGWSI